MPVQPVQDIFGLSRLADQIRANRQEASQAPIQAAQTELLQGRVQQQRQGLADLARTRQEEAGLRAAIEQAPEGQDIDFTALSYYGKTNPKKRREFESHILDTATKIATFDPKGASDLYQRKTGQTLDFTPQGDGFGRPFAAVGPEGQPIFAQVGKGGKARTVEGIKPPVKKGQTIRSLPGGGFEVITGEGGGTGEKFTEVQAKTGGMATRVEAANAISKELEDNPDFDPASVEQAIKGGVPLAGNLLVTEDQRVYDQAKTDFISAVLRLESGAAISDAEYVRENKKYFPQPGDGPRVIANKRKARERQLEILKSNSGGSYDAIKKAIVVSEHPTLGDITEEEILETMKNHKMTRQQVMDRLQGEGVQ